MAEVKDRITVVEKVYHQSVGEQPTQADVVFVRNLLTKEQPYVRHVKVGENWTPVDYGWLNSVSFVVIQNDEGKFVVVPTPEELATVMARVVDVSFKESVGHGSLQIPPGESLRCSPSDDTSTKALCLRCRSGVAQVTITAYPE